MVVGDRVLTGRDHGAGQVHAFEPPVPDLPGLTRFETLLAAIHATLAGYGNPRVTTGVDLSTRQPGPAGTIGPYATELPVDSAARPRLPVRAVRRRAARRARAMYPHRCGAARPCGAPAAAARRGSRPVSVSYRRLGDAPRVRRRSRRTSTGWRSPAACGATCNCRRSTTARPSPRGCATRPRRAPVAARFAEDLCAGARRGSPPPRRPGCATCLLRAVAGPARRGRRTGVHAGAGDTAARSSSRSWPSGATCSATSAIGPDDDLFDLGGDSLTATQIIARMRKTARPRRRHRHVLRPPDGQTESCVPPATR